MMLGINRDSAFGPVVMLALGGIFVETLKDTVIRLAPLNKAEALAMIDSLKGASVLRGARGKPVADVEALADTIVILSRFAAGNEWLDGVDINPLMVRPKGKGVMAVDALVNVGKPVT
jgi:acyl-CoA synthetase (NDP forming)